MLRESVSKSF